MLNGWANIPPTLRGDGAGKVQPKGHMTPTCPCNSHVHLAENRVLANFMVITPRNQGWVGDLQLFGTIRGMGLLTCIKIALKWRSSWGWFSNATPKGRPKGIIPDQMTTDIYIYRYGMLRIRIPLRPIQNGTMLICKKTNSSLWSPSPPQTFSIRTPQLRVVKYRPPLRAGAFHGTPKR